MRRVGIALAAAGIPLGIACSLTLPFDGLDDGVRDGATATDAANDPIAIDASDAGPEADVATDATDASTDGCVSNEGPAFVAIAGFCIDATEVTVDQYTRFLVAKAGDISGQPSHCAWNSSLVPVGWPPAGPGTQALGGVNWCMAATYCAWAGKRLCGSPDGGPADENDWGNPAKSQWFRACSHNNDGLHVFPYGNTYDPARCNGKDYDAGQALPSLSTCQGGYPGLFDMGGNVFEWEDSCVPPDPDASDKTGAPDFCHTRGGAFSENGDGTRCDEGILFTRGSAAANLGIRCCSK
jgi:sulfatase modifying factor 1